MSAKGATRAVIGSAVGAGAIVGLAQYAPTTQASYFLTNTSMAAVDTTNLTFTPTVPANGKLLLEINIDWLYNPPTNGSVYDFFVGYLKHGSGTPVGLPNSVFGQLGFTSTEAFGGHTITRTLATGLTPGPLQLDIAAALSAAASGAYCELYAMNGGSINADPTSPALMIAYAVP